MFPHCNVTVYEEFAGLPYCAAFSFPEKVLPNAFWVPDEERLNNTPNTPRQCPHPSYCMAPRPK